MSIEQFVYATRTTHITGKVLLAAQDDLIRVELAFKGRDELVDAPLIRRQALHGLE
jgi:hypothetical protein